MLNLYPISMGEKKKVIIYTDGWKSEAWWMADVVMYENKSEKTYLWK